MHVRAARPDDVAFITSSWLKSYRDAPAVKNCPNSLYYAAQHEVLNVIVPRAVTLVVTTEALDKPIMGKGIILGYMCAEMTAERILVVHYIYIKRDFRNFGLARMLLETMIETEQPLGIHYTHQTFAGMAIAKDHKEELELVYNPYFITYTVSI